MLEITEKDIASLGDSDLRDLVAKLAVAELRSQGCPVSAVTAGGNQDARDGGIDVRVDCPKELVCPDFVPRRQTGFQVKKPDMPRSEIREEMRPNGVLRNVIRQLAEVSGAYIIVSSQGSVADAPLAERRKAMREALSDIPDADQIHVDFYDRVRLVSWVNLYAGITAWVKQKTGNQLAGWINIGKWNSFSQRPPQPYLFNDKACVIDERSKELQSLTISESIVRLRAGLRNPQQCIRLIGLSGVGKTRLVEALFEEGVGEDALDPSIAIYTDYSEDVEPTARNMARKLIAQNQRAILLIDNCNPQTHSELAKLCRSDSSQLSLLTVEYDVADDEPERTDVFRLQTSSPELVCEWIKVEFTNVSPTDREAIAEFSDGNFRVASVLASTLEKGETLGQLKDRALFDRIFHQRNQPDPELMRAAEDLALLYSIDGDDIKAEGELAKVAAIRKICPNILYEALGKLKERGLVQSRGRFRAILPQAIANPLAAKALERLAPANVDSFCSTLKPRMLKSLSRRLGFLHDSQAAKNTVSRLLHKEGPLGDLFSLGGDSIRIISNLAPVLPEMVLSRVEECLASDVDHRWFRLLKALGYSIELFDRSVDLLARYAGAQEENNNLNSARNLFCEFFHIYLSGTQASPQMRRDAIRRLARSEDPVLCKSASIAIRAMLDTGSFLFSGEKEFGARPRDWGWLPTINQDIWDWYEAAISLVNEIEPEADARVILANALRKLWPYPNCRAALISTGKKFIQSEPWIEGWIACRAVIRFDFAEMPLEAKKEIELLIEFLKPTDILNKARAIVINRMQGGGWDYIDGEEDDDVMLSWTKANEMAKDLGRAIAQDSDTRSVFITEVLTAPNPQRAYEFGIGLAEGAVDLDLIWDELVSTYREAMPSAKNLTVLGGFIHGANQLDRSFTSSALDEMMSDADLLLMLPYFQCIVGIDSSGITRLRNSIKRGLSAASFSAIVNGSLGKSPASDLANLLIDIASLPGGGTTAFEILSMSFNSRSQSQSTIEKSLIDIGRELLLSVNFSKVSDHHDYAIGEVIRYCLRGDDGCAKADIVCRRLCVLLCSKITSLWDLSYSVAALFEAQPRIALDCFLLSQADSFIFAVSNMRLGNKFGIEKIPIEILRSWASVEPNTRYPLLGKCILMFNDEDDKNGCISTLFMSLLEIAPDKIKFCGDLRSRIYPQSWFGSLVDILAHRRKLLLEVTKDSEESVQSWMKNSLSEMDLWIEIERKRDRAHEESFE